MSSSLEVEPTRTVELNGKELLLVVQALSFTAEHSGDFPELSTQLATLSKKLRKGCE